MAWIPRMKLYSEADVLLYEFEIVQYTNVPQSPGKSVIIEGTRGEGAIVIPGGKKSWELIISGVLTIDGATEGYEELTAKINAMETTILDNIRYKIRLDKSPSTYWEYNVKRIKAIEYPENMRTESQEYTVRFLANSWA